LGGVAHPWKIFCNPASLDHGVLIVGYGVSKYNKGTYYVRGKGWKRMPCAKGWVSNIQLIYNTCQNVSSLKCCPTRLEYHLLILIDSIGRGKTFKGY